MTHRFDTQFSHRDRAAWLNVKAQLRREG